MRRLASLLATAFLFALPATALAAEEAGGGTTDRTTEIMIGLIIVLMIGMILIGIIEQRRSH
jgi:hypothetical protein